MPWHVYLVAILGICGATPICGAEFPYTAYVNSGDVYVRSGPGRDYYPTDKLPKGEKVEVYRHDPGGWYAIRPPRQSFSWVSSRHIDAAEDGLAVVNGPRVVARVGSAFSDVRDVIQVRLKQGEKVELLDPLSGDSPWCKISPPAGEFRWIFSKFVSQDGAPEVAQDERETAGAFSDSRVDNREAGVRLASGAGESHSTSNAFESSAATGAAPAGSLSREAVSQRELDRVELELSAMVADEISVWSFAELQHRAEALLDQAQTPVERGRARVLLNKLARFDDIKQRQDAIRRVQDDTDRRNSQVGSSDLHRNQEPRYDGVGRLSPVISQKSGGPQFALVDQSNAVISFVTAAPGVNLRPYLDRYVGVNGQRGYMTDLQKQHINVARVTVLDATRR